jgi:uncharacterized protein (DUF2384 family)
MGFSRNLSGPRGETLKTSDVVAAVMRATAHVRGELSADEAADLARLRDVVSSGGDLNQNDKNTLKHLNQVSKGPELSQEEIELVPLVAQLAEKGVDLMGGDAHVHVLASSREVSPGVVEKSIVATIALTTKR